MARIVMAVTNDLVTDQRVRRACRTLVGAGHEVKLIGRRLPQSEPVGDTPYETFRMRLLFRSGPLFYAEYNCRLLLHLLSCRLDIVYANDTDTLLAAYVAARLRRRPLFFDAHELFPEVPELEGRRTVRAVWMAIERFVFARFGRKVRAKAVTVSKSVADEYRRRYSVEMRVVRNVPERSVRESDSYADDDSFVEYLRKLRETSRILLYQGSVNKGRGVEQLVAAMRWLDDWHLVVAGVGDLYLDIVSEVSSLPWRNRITMLGRVSPERLCHITPLAHLGWVVMESQSLNYRCSLPNRVGDYIAAGVPFLSSPYVELQRVIDTYAVGFCLPDRLLHGDAGELAAEIRRCYARWQRLDPSVCEARFESARRDFDWRKDSAVLLKEIEKLIIEN